MVESPSRIQIAPPCLKVCFNSRGSSKGSSSSPVIGLNLSEETFFTRFFIKISVIHIFPKRTEQKRKKYKCTGNIINLNK